MSDSVRNSTKGPSNEAYDPIPGFAEASRREDIARIMLDNLPLIRRRIRGKLRHIRAMALLDADDMVGSVWRRVDLAVAEGRLRAAGECEFWSYVHRTIDHLILSRTRDVKPHAPLPSDGADSCDNNERSTADIAASAATDAVHDIMEFLTPSERELFTLKLREASYPTMAQATDRSEQSLRTAWSKLCRSLRRNSCPQCAYDLSATLAERPCPECGALGERRP